MIKFYLLTSSPVIIKYLRNAILLCILSSISNAVSGQSVDWVLSNPVFDNNNLIKTASCDGNKIIISGFFDTLSTLQLGNSPVLTSRGGSDCFVASMNPDKSFNWIKQIGGNSDDYMNGEAIVDVNHNIIVTGRFNDSIWLDNLSLTGSTPGEIFIAKLDQSGNAIWMKQISSVGGMALGAKLNLSSNNNGDIFISGSYNTDIDFDGNVFPCLAGGLFNSDVFLAKYDSNGNLIWVRTLSSGSSELCLSSATFSDGGVCISGVFSDSLSFGGVTRHSHGLFDIFVVKYDSVGTLKWVRTFGSTFDDYATSIAIRNNDVYVASTFRNDIVVDTMHFFTNDPYNDRLLLIRLDMNGDAVWAKNYNVIPLLPNITVQNNGDILFTTAFYNQGSIDQFQISADAIGSTDGIIAFSDSIGNVHTLFQNSNPTPLQNGKSIEYIFDVSFDALGNVYAPGMTEGVNVEWGGITVPSAMFMVKINSATTILNSGILKNTFEIYPNPTHNMLTWNSTAGIESINIYTMNGRQIHESKSMEEGTIDVSFLSPGTYLFEMKTKEGIYKKLITKN